MSECYGAGCNHPACNGGSDTTTSDLDQLTKRVENAFGVPPEKWAVMNRAERRAAMRGKRGGR